MVTKSWVGRGWQWVFASGVALVGVLSTGLEECLLAQIVPDGTLGAERSVVIPLDPNFPFDVIDGGALRDTNLFHSFEQFNVNEGRGAYFFSPNADIQNILARVTGNDPSDILGTIGTFGNSNPNLFLINPNGILFGENARLDVPGSFVGTTANAVQFGEQGFFSATNPEVPSPLLAIAPSAFLFNQVPAGNIINRATAPIRPGSNILGLRVGDRENLLLLGGNVNINGGWLNALGGRVEIGAVAGAGTVGLNADGSLNFPADVQRADVSLTNGARVDVRFGDGGNIAITGRNIDIAEESLLIAGIDPGFGSPDSQVGDVVLNAEGIRLDGSTVFNAVFGGGIGNSGDIRITTGSLSLTNGAQIDTSLFGQGNAGDIIINARDTVSLDGTRLIPFGELGSVLFAEVLDGAEGNGGDIFINTGSLSVTNGGAIIARTRGQGDAGNIIIRARDTVSFDGTSGAGSSNASSGVGPGAVGRGGNIEITAGSLSVTNEARLNASTSGQGSAGKIVINVRDRVLFNRADASSFVGRDAEGVGGNIEITTGSLALVNNAALFAGTRGQGSSGSVIINARDRVTLDGAGIFSNIGREAIGNGGNIEIATDSLAITNRAVLFAGTLGQGSSGSIVINARDRVTLDRSGIYSNVEDEAVGNGGNIEINTDSLTATNKSQVFADTSGRGNAGNIIINARDRIFSDAETLFISGIERGGVGRGGNITITTNTLSFTSGANLITRTRGRGDAGNIFITARDAVSFTGVAEDGNPSTGAFSNVRDNAVGRGGNVEITAGSLTVTDGAQLTANTSGQGNAGSVVIRVRDGVVFAGTTPDLQFGSAANSTVDPGAIGIGGNVEITAGSLLVQGGAQLLSATEGQGDAGNVIIQVNDWVVFDGESPDGRFATGAFSSVQSGAVGTGGNVEISTGSLSVTNGAQLVAATRGEGDAGNVIIQANDRVVFDGDSEIGKLSSGAFSSVDPRAVGRGGNIDISTNSLFLTNGGQLGADTFGQGNAGNVIIRVSEAVFLEGISRNGSSPSISTLTAGQGRGGTITISAPLFQIADGAAVDARTISSSRGGDITINADTFAAVNGGQIITSTHSNGQAGNIALNANRISLSGRNQVSVDRLDSVSIARRQGNGESGLFANTRPNSTGEGGTITLNTNTLSLSDRAQISARSQGTGQAGGVAITADETVTLANSDITTAAQQASGGGIVINAGDIRLFGDSDITTNVFSGADNGGNINLTADSIIAFEDSDILAFARDGRGGDITLNTPAFFGENFQPAPKNTDPATLDNNDRVDINATGAVSGVVTLPDTSFIQNSLTELPDNPIDTDNLIANSCIARSSEQGGSFLVTGGGGFLQRPGDLFASSYATGTVRSVPSEGEESVSGTQETRPWKIGDPIVEPQGVYRLANGELVMSRECS